MALLHAEEAMFRREAGDILEAKGQLDEAVKLVAGIQYSDEEQTEAKVGDYLLLAEWWFEMDDSTQAEIFVNRSKHIVHNVANREI